MPVTYLSELVFTHLNLEGIEVYSVCFSLRLYSLKGISESTSSSALLNPFSLRLKEMIKEFETINERGQAFAWRVFLSC